MRIIQTPGTARCRACGQVLELDQPFGRCACGNTDFRYPEDDWRAIAPNLARWYDRFRRRPSMRATEPGETPFDSDDARSGAGYG